MNIDWKEYSDKIMAIAATVTAVIALVVAVLEVRNQQDFQKLSVEPYIEMGNVGTDQLGYYAFLLVNNGLGPAIIKSGNFTVDGASVSGWYEAEAFHREMSTDRVMFEICYCSIYEECWRTVYGEQVTHQPIAECEIL